MFASRLEVLAHNVETVPRIFKRIRPAFRYQRSLDVLAAADGLVTKSNLILGMGETPEEVTIAMQDLHDAGCDILTITQYLRPSPRHHPVERWVKPEEFVEHARAAEQIGFAGVMAGPLVRSSYRAGRLCAQSMAHHGRTPPPAMAQLAEEGTGAQEAKAVLARRTGGPGKSTARHGGPPASTHQVSSGIAQIEPSLSKPDARTQPS